VASLVCVAGAYAEGDRVSEHPPAEVYSLVFTPRNIKHTLQNIQNDCHQWLFDSSRRTDASHSFSTGAADSAEGAYSAPPNSLACLRGPTSKRRGGKEKGMKEVGERREKERQAWKREGREGEGGKEEK